MKRIDIVSDAICPWCWIGKRQLDLALAGREHEFVVTWRPFQLNPDMPPEGVSRAAYRAAKFGSATRGAELDAQVAAAGRAIGLEFRHALMQRTPNTIRAHRLLRRATGVPGAQHPLAEALFQAYFHDGRDIGDAPTLADIATAQGMQDAAAFLLSDEHDAEVRAEDAEFRRLGISGVPSFALDGRLMFSGALPATRMAEAFGI